MLIRGSSGRGVAYLGLGLVACSGSGASGAPSGGALNPGGTNGPAGSSTAAPTSTAVGDDTGGLIGGIDTTAGPTGPVLADGCNEVQITFEPQTPTVMILLDRSSSMFEQVVGTTTLWATVKQAIYDVVAPLQGDLRFGFVSYTGLQDGTVPPSGQPTQNIPPATTTVTCPLFSPQVPVTPALNNLAAIQPLYDALLDPAATPPNQKGETPTGLAYQQTMNMLLAFPEPGSKFIILITDGQPDFCNESQCAEDHAVSAVQAAFAGGIRTIVFGLGVAAMSHIQDLANAGAGVEVAWPAAKLFCAGDNGNPADTATRFLSTYAAPGIVPPNALAYFSANADSLATELAAQISGVKSCVFDLAGQIEIRDGQGGQGTVKLCQTTDCNAAAAGTSLPFADPNGWQLNSSTQIELVGAGCSELQDRATAGIFIDFPCEAIIIR